MEGFWALAVNYGASETDKCFPSSTSHLFAGGRSISLAISRRGHVSQDHASDIASWDRVCYQGLRRKGEKKRKGKEKEVPSIIIDFGRS